MYYKDLSKLIYRIFKKHNLSSKDSKICSDAITQSELVEATSHGLSRLKMYCDRINTVSYTHLTLPTNDQV